MKRIDDKTRAAVIAEYAVGNPTTREVAKKTGVSEASVRRILKEDIDKLTQIDAKKKLDFVAEVDKLIYKAVRAADMKLDDIINDPDVRAKINISSITTSIGTLYDKRALAKGESTDNSTVTIKLPKELMEYAE